MILTLDSTRTPFPVCDWNGNKNKKQAHHQQEDPKHSQEVRKEELKDLKDDRRKGD